MYWTLENTNFFKSNKIKLLLTKKKKKEKKRKKRNNAICSNTDGSRNYNTKWSNSEKNKYHITSMWNLIKINFFHNTLLLLSRFSRVWLCATHRWQPTRLPHPWDSPGKNTGVGCHFLLQCMKVKSESEVAQWSDSSRPHGLQPIRLLHPWDFPGKCTGVGCHQPTQKISKSNNGYERENIRGGTN